MSDKFKIAHAKVSALVKLFVERRDFYLSGTYQEQEARKDFIDKFFTALGWDVNHDTQTNPYEQEVKIEKSIRTGEAKRRADYAFSIAPNFRRPQFFVEAKRPQSDLRTPDNYFQIIRYSWNHQLPLAILTDFQSLHIVDCRFRPNIKTALLHNIQTYTYLDFLNEQKFAEIYWLFSREAIAGDSIGKYVSGLKLERTRAKQLVLLPGAYQSVDDAFLEKLDSYREDLARSFKRLNPNLTGEQLTECVQRILDRLVFIRFLEDKLIEPQPIIDKLGGKKTPWRDFVKQCDRLDKTYNGIVFKKHPIIDAAEFKVDESVFLDICDELSDSASPYDFNAIPIEILGRIYERFLGKVVVATAARARVEEKHDIRKAEGVYYTPDYIVAHMVEASLSPIIDGKSPDELLKIRIIDTSCGSGSFLIGAYDFLIRQFAKLYTGKPSLARKGDVIMRGDTLQLSLKKKREILINCIYGVDIDAQAVEVAQLSLYLKLLEEETTESAHAQQIEIAAALLPSLSRNIISGNSLISTDTEQKERDLFSVERAKELNALDFQRAFPKIMKEENGFDLVIGNPPYIKEYTNKDAFKYVTSSPYYEGKMDIWYMFACRGIDILKPETGTLAFIATNNWLTNFGAKILRRKISDECEIQELIDFGEYRVFRDANIQTMILVAKKSKRRDIYDFDYRKLQGKKLKLADAQALLAATEQPGVYTLAARFNRAALRLQSFSFSEHDENELLDKIKRASNYRLSKSDIAQGIVAPQDNLNAAGAETLHGEYPVGTGIFVLSDEEYEGLNLSKNEKSLVKPFYTTDELSRYYGNPDNRFWVIYTDSSFQNPAKIKPYPKLKTHLDQFKKVITSHYKPYGLHRARSQAFFEGEKIVSVRKCAAPTFTYTNFDCYVSQTFNVIKPTVKINFKFLSALLNSKVIKYWLRKKGKMQGNNYQIDREPLLELPLIMPSFSVQESISKWVDQILKATKELQSATTEADQNIYQRLIDSADDDIQSKIYELYNLLPAEIAAIEKI